MRLLRIRSAWSGRTAIGIGIASALVVAFYELTAVGNRSEADDAFCFAYGVEQEPLRRLMAAGHVQHLLYLPLMRALYRITEASGLSARAYDVMRHTSTAAAGLSVVLLALLLRRRLGLSRFAASSASAGLAVSYGFWRYSNEAEVYSLAILLIIGLLWLAFRRDLSLSSAALGGGIAAVAVLVHVLSIVPALVAVPVIWLRRHPGHVLVYLATTVMIIGSTSYLSYRYVDPSDQGFGDYLLSNEPGTTRSPELSVGDALQSAIGSGQAVVTGNFLFAFDDVAERLRSALPAKTLVEESFAGERAGAVVRVVPPVALTLLLTLAVLLVFRLRREVVNGWDRRLAAMVAWVAVYWVVVVAAGSGPAAEAWTPLLVALWVLMGALVFQHARRRTDQVLVLGLVAALLLHNLFGGFWMMKDGSTDYNAAKARWLVEHPGPRDVILTADAPVFFRYLRYQAKASVYQLRGLTGSELDLLYSRVRGADDLYVTASVFDPPADFWRVDGPAGATLKRFGARISDDFGLVHRDEFGAVYLRLDDPPDRPMGSADVSDGLPPGPLC